MLLERPEKSEEATRKPFKILFIPRLHKRDRETTNRYGVGSMVAATGWMSAFLGSRIASTRFLDTSFRQPDRTPSRGGETRNRDEGQLGTLVMTKRGQREREASQLNFGYCTAYVAEGSALGFDSTNRYVGMGGFCRIRVFSVSSLPLAETAKGCRSNNVTFSGLGVIHGMLLQCDERF